MIEIKNLHKAFDQKVLFDNFNMNIESGDFVIFSGVSGCGKTTLLNMIGALEKVDSGTIKIDGIDISKRKNQLKYFSEKVGFLFQNFALMEDRTVNYNLNIIKKKNRSEIEIREALHRVGLEDKLNSKIYTLSGGEQQRIALARLMVKKCDLILADEPTGSLDKDNANKVMAIMKELNDEGKTVIVVSHDENIKKNGKRVINL
ncbi:ATP-binding cassette domain-containing protein [Clostridium formicaceticum]|uniref:Bacteriocin ABC transporter ATP-binding protein n=1 Tax=Clostridium formicaceticum TaxID=1497 RepID=A0AAC9WHX1_9CLOT|nr:ATP-binding cassette domain-containing protein [Clostridium formicaceticum]AOY77591.1 bacteriocin ABC transporter ATP-binding protein [Clostridium formicaceticum]ARE88170.1 Macrolide export ATP-binding/permease protein MacB [Clostridium formicaceticum]